MFRAWMHQIAVAAFVILCTILPGCRKEAKETAATSPQPPASAPTTRPWTKLTIDERPMIFPPARLIATPQGAQLHCVLRSDAPSKDTPAGNSFMFDMQLDVDTVQNLSTIAWHFKAPSDEPQDSTAGIYLNDNHRQLQPLDVNVTFQNQADRVTATLSGEFLSVDPQDADVPTQHVNVSGTIDAAVEEQN